MTSPAPNEQNNIEPNKVDPEPNNAVKSVKTKKRRRSKAARNPLVILANLVFSLLILAALGAGFGIYYLKKTFNDQGPLQQAEVIWIKPGTGIKEISTMLASSNIISNDQIFVYGIGWEQKTKALKAGEYEIPAHASMRDVMNILVLGRSIEHSITIPEGWTVTQALNRIGSNEILTGDLANEKMPPEGGLMADTVTFLRGTTRADIVRRLQQKQDKLVKDIWATRAADLPIKNINEFVTLASIVEKETGIASERPQVAAVFVNRLRKNMRLQSDPTIIYGLFGGTGKPSGRPIYRSDIDKETPYNTYRINGLPPTPIAIPGKDALMAVANPPKTEDLYFVADGTGGHAFAKTLDEHNQNVRKWREVERSGSTAPN